MTHLSVTHLSVYPSQGRPRPPRLFSREHGMVKLHPASVLTAAGAQMSHRWLVFAEMVRTATGLFIYDGSEVRIVPIPRGADPEARANPIPKGADPEGRADPIPRGAGPKRHGQLMRHPFPTPLVRSRRCRCFSLALATPTRLTRPWPALSSACTWLPPLTHSPSRRLALPPTRCVLTWTARLRERCACA